MNEPDQKKCPKCGQVMKPDKPCERCSGREGFAVEYKDFKISELLDIKMSVKKDEEPEEGEK